MVGPIAAAGAAEPAYDAARGCVWRGLPLPLAGGVGV